jgi:hypothetical protein
MDASRAVRAIVAATLLLAGCTTRTKPHAPGVAASGGATGSTAPDDTEMSDLLARCGYDTSNRTTNARPGWMKDREACLAFVRGAYARKAASRGMESIEWLPDAVAVAANGCTHEGLGEACRWMAYDALEMYEGLTAHGRDATDWAEAIRRHLARGCDLGDAACCSIRATGQDSGGRRYPVDPND